MKTTVFRFQCVERFFEKLLEMRFAADSKALSVFFNDELFAKNAELADPKSVEQTVG